MEEMLAIIKTQKIETLIQGLSLAGSESLSFPVAVMALVFVKKIETYG